MPLRSHTFDLSDLNSPKQVRNTNELKAAIRRAGPGDVIELENGNYSFYNFTINRAEEEEENNLPIVIRAKRTGFGAVI